MLNKELSCYGCPDRCLGCHSSCSGYQDRCKENAANNEARRAEIYYYNGVDQCIRNKNKQQKQGWHRREGF
jgi:pyruvate-formate lyase-activating enzyme